jgi:adenine-specific DNA-methyltransferase
LGVRYIGSKMRVAEAIVSLAGDADEGRFVDAFCGTGSVAKAAATQGWRVVINDSLASAVTMATGLLVSRTDISFQELGGYESACSELDLLDPEPGFLHAEYSPASALRSEIERRYFTESNAARLDSMRNQIAEWRRKGVLNDTEHQLLLADLMLAANRVANISGTYGCFLSGWTNSALRPVCFRPRRLAAQPTSFEAKVGDVFDLETTDADTVYFDPPYTKRQYAAYYHILETLTAGDSPDVKGVTGLRPWRDKASDFCYKKRALEALTRLVMTTRARRVLLSYSSEGHVQQDHLISSLADAGDVTVHELKTIGRYRPNAGASAGGESVNEYVIEVVPLRRQEEGRREFTQVASR